MNPTDKTVAEFFAGIGLVRIGLENAGWRIAFANDIDQDKWQMYEHNFGNTGEFLVEDIHRLKAEQIPTVGLATASFPCNDLSLAGARHGLAGQQSSVILGVYRHSQRHEARATIAADSAARKLTWRTA